MTVNELTLGIMASFNIGRLSFEQLSELITPFGITETALRTGLSRMIQNGLMSADRNSRPVSYCLTKKSRTVTGNISAPFKIKTENAWAGDFWGIAYSVPGNDTSRRHRLRKKLSAYRFGSLNPGLWIRPVMESEPPYNGLEDLEDDPACRLIRFTPRSRLTRDECRSIWKLGEKEKSMKDALTLIETALPEIPGFAPEEAFIRKMETGKKAVNALAGDPLLPAELLPAGWLADELRNLFALWDREITKAAVAFFIPIIKGE